MRAREKASASFRSRLRFLYAGFLFLRVFKEKIRATPAIML